MAEERIYIGKINWQEPAGFCPVPMGECNSFCEDCQGGMTRQEAIERMKNAGLKYACRANGRDIPEEVHHHYANMMEAALNALLEEEK